MVETANQDTCDRFTHVELDKKSRQRQRHDHWTHKHSVDGENTLKSFLQRTKLIMHSVDGVAESARHDPHHDSRKEMSTGYMSVFHEPCKSFVDATRTSSTHGLGRHDEKDIGTEMLTMGGQLMGRDP